MVAVSLIIGVYVFSTIGNSIDKNKLSTAANSSIDNIMTNTYNGFTLGAIVVIVIAASAILRSLVF